MSLILDTNIISELSRLKPANEVIDWLSRVDEDSLYLSVLTLGEIQDGISRLEEGGKKQKLIIWMEKIKDSYKNQLYPITAEIAEKWGELNADYRKSGHSLPIIDGLIAATAAVTGSILVTRNTSDFEAAGIRLMNPWETE